MQQNFFRYFRGLGACMIHFTAQMVFVALAGQVRAKRFNHQLIFDRHPLLKMSSYVESSGDKPHSAISAPPPPPRCFLHKVWEDFRKWIEGDIEGLD